MPRDRLTFRQRDLNAALKVVQARGLKVARIEVRDDGVVIIPANGDCPSPGADAEETQMRKVLRNAAKNAHKS